jgi:hypothetical protein
MRPISNSCSALVVMYRPPFHDSRPTFTQVVHVPEFDVKFGPASKGSWFEERLLLTVHLYQKGGC